MPCLMTGIKKVKGVQHKKGREKNSAAGAEVICVLKDGRLASFWCLTVFVMMLHGNQDTVKMNLFILFLFGFPTGSDSYRRDQTRPQKEDLHGDQQAEHP